jgi:signal recognition particle GTPase
MSYHTSHPYPRFCLARVRIPYVYFSFQLIRINDPDLILFVGEALVGNEAVDQLSKFNQALADFSSQENPRLIDGILLTKFDTIDDKVWWILLNLYKF